MKKSFDNLPQRCINYFLATIPPFKAVKSDLADANEQKNAYDFIRSIYENISNSPLLLGFKITPDDFFTHCYQPQKEKPDLSPKIRVIIKKTNEFIRVIYDIVNSGIIKDEFIILEKSVIDIKPALVKKLAAFKIGVKTNEAQYSVEFPTGTIKGLKLLALISAENAALNKRCILIKTTEESLLFSRGIFDPSAPYTSEVFSNIIENKKGFNKLINYFENNGFKRIDNKEGKISLDYVKLYGKCSEAIGSAWKIRNYSGIEFVYDELTESCVKIGLRIPHFRELCEGWEKMSENALNFVYNSAKCSGCGYCVQTSKSKDKPLRYVKTGKGNICPLYTFGFTYNDFLETDMGLIDIIIEFMEHIHNIFKDKQVDC